MSSVKSRTPRQRILFESRREREFYRYYEPIRALSQSGPPLCDLNDAAAVSNHRPTSSPDRALTAFCQLGALRLRTRRAMLFFFDVNYAYILAEATRTLSLENDSVHDIEDHLWMGHSIIPRGFSVCEHTVNLPSQGSNQADPSADVVHIINDLTEDTRFCDRPFVTDGPKARFYAGVPITTPKGINIGAYCVLDDKAHPGLDEKGINFLRDMAATIMAHLDRVRAKVANERGTQMVAGLSAFVEGASGLQGWTGETGGMRTRRPSAEANRHQSMRVQHPGSLPGSDGERALNGTAQMSGSQSATLPNPAADDSTKDKPGSSTTSDSTTPSIGIPSIDPSCVGRSKRQAEDLREELVASNVRATFHRAAQLVREAVEVDGAIFLDASVGTYAGLINNDGRHSVYEQTSDPPSSGADAKGSEGQGLRGGTRSETENELKECPVLASSHAAGTEEAAGAESCDANDTVPMSERFLHSLLRRYPHGKIWNFNEEGDASSDDESSDGWRSSDLASTPSDGNSAGEVLARKKRRSRRRIDDSRKVQSIFPGVRSLALVGMWDNMRERWFAACAIWTYSPLRLLSDQCEVNFTTAFCDVIMAEVHRMEAQTSDKAKIDFISSISHELRSPLHGILGSAECLQEQITDSSSTELISQIETCGQTLLDIVDHLLDYSKINHYARRRSGHSIDHQGRRRILTADGSARQQGGMMSLDSDVLLDVITEEVVETAVYSFCCSRDKEVIFNRRVSVILDIDRSLDIDWRCRIAIGGWKRICINLVSNALKYTAEGYVRVSLTAVPVQNKTRRFDAVLTVSDTGRGMSKEYLKNNLFKAFSQEDSFMEGTGLGMSLVAEIVKSLEGSITTQSTKDVGTTVTVTLPLDSSRRSSHEAAESARRLKRKVLEDRTVGVGKLDGSDEESAPLDHSVHRASGRLLHESLKNTCAELGLRTLDVNPLQPKAVDLYIVTEPQFELFQKQDFNQEGDSGNGSVLMFATEGPLLVVCNSVISERRLRLSHVPHLNGRRAEFISQPVGPDRLLKAIQSCLASSGEGYNNIEIESSIEPMAPRTYGYPTMGDKETLQNLMNSEQSHKEFVVRSKMWKRNNSDGVSPISMYRDPLIVEPASVGDADLQPHLETGPLSPPLLTPQETFQELQGPDELPKESQSALDTAAPQNFANGSGISLMLVEDNPINLQLLLKYAEKKEYRRLVARDGRQAVEAYKTARGSGAAGNQHSTPLQNRTNGAVSESGEPMVILMDINMPILNGFEATRQIRHFERDQGLAPVTIIALTGLGSASAQQEAYSSGVDLFLTKPVRLRELTSILDSIKRKKVDGQGL